MMVNRLKYLILSLIFIFYSCEASKKREIIGGIAPLKWCKIKHEIGDSIILINVPNLLKSKTSIQKSCIGQNIQFYNFCSSLIINDTVNITINSMPKDRRNSKVNMHVSEKLIFQDMQETILGIAPTAKIIEKSNIIVKGKELFKILWMNGKDINCNIVYTSYDNNFLLHIAKIKDKEILNSIIRSISFEGKYFNELFSGKF